MPTAEESDPNRRRARSPRARRLVWHWLAIPLGIALLFPALAMADRRQVATQPASIQPAATQLSSVPTTQPASSTQPAPAAALAKPRMPGTQPAATQPAAIAPKAPAKVQQLPPTATSDFGELLMVIVFFAVFTSVLAYVWRYTRAKALAKQTEAQDDAPAFTLDELRQLRDSGQMTQEEFLRARTLVLEKERQRMKDDAEAQDEK